MSLRGLRILMCHNRYRPPAGGEDLSASAEVALLREAGAEVETYEVSNEAIPDRPGVRYGVRTLWSTESYREVRRRLRAGRHRVLHVQNFFPLLSPAVFWAARQEGVAVVAALRNYRLACVNGLLYRDGRICEDCLGRLPLPAVRHRCYRESLLASSAVAGMIISHRVLRTWQRAVDVFVTPSQFARRKLAQAGLDASRVLVKPNFVHPDPGPRGGEGRFVVYAGRLSPEKGIRTLLDAWRALDGAVRLVVVGAGPLQSEIQRAARELPGIEFRGQAEPSEVLRLMGEAALVVVPSVWYETFGRVVAEAFAVGTPVVASNIGPLAEMVEPGRNGALVPPGDPGALAATVRELLADPDSLATMREGARRTYEAYYTAGRNLELLEAIYATAMERSRVG